MKALIKNPKTFIEELFRLERAGKYQEAIAELKDVWYDTEDFPNVDDFEPSIAAELIMRCGCLIGFQGHNEQLSSAQEKSKNLLCDSRQRFLELLDFKKIAECENYIALAYWRTGELVEAQAWIEESLSHDLSFSEFSRLYSCIIESKIDFALGNFLKTREKFDLINDDFLTYGDSTLKGDFFNHYGLVLRRLGEPLEALEKYELARHFHQKSGHKIYLGTVENNIAFLQKSESNFVSAHEAIDRATKLFSEIGDKTREGFSLDTKAQIYFEEGNFVDALKTVEAALEILEKGENAGYLVETYLTKSKILLAMNDFSSATFALFDGVQIAKTKISEESARNLIKEFEAEMGRRKTVLVDQIFTEKDLISGDLQLSLPASISHFGEYQAVRIKNSHLTDIGLSKDSLAIVVNEFVKRGDLAAVMEINEGHIYCGYFDVDFGIVCLEGIGSEPLLLDESDTTILGKIVGVCSGEQDQTGKLIVKAV